MKLAAMTDGALCDRCRQRVSAKDASVCPLCRKEEQSLTHLGLSNALSLPDEDRERMSGARLLSLSFAIAVAWVAIGALLGAAWRWLGLLSHWLGER